MHTDIRRSKPGTKAGVLLSLFALAGFAAPALADPAQDAKVVAALDTQYQLAVKRNDAETMDRILHDDFILVLGTGDAYNKAHLLKNARDKKYVYELQDNEAGTQVVRMFGDTAIVTAKLLLKATTGGKTVEMKLWFSDTYVRTPTGWRYAFGQASLPLPKP